MGASYSAVKKPAVAATTSAQVIYQKTTIVTNAIVWLDTEVNTAQDNLHAQQQLRKINNNMRTFENPYECQEYVQRLPSNHQIILIVSGQLGREIVPHIHFLKQIKSIYVFCANKQKNEQWAHQYTKIKAVTVQLDELVERICSDLNGPKEQTDELLPMDIFINNQSTTGLDGQYVQFLMVINMLLQLKSNETDRRELIALCKQDYRGQEVEEWFISEFEQSYSSSKALWWYTRESFLYKMLNKALRKQDFDTLFLFRWFIADIHQQLSRYQCQCPIRVYRGQLMTNKEVERLKRSIGKLISFSSFLSASLLEQQAIFYQNNASATSELQRVLFEIDADPQVVIDKPFADLSSHSDFAGECEVLFMLGCVFRIDSVSHRGNGKGWSIHMTLFDESDHHLSELIEEMAANWHSAPSMLSFGTLLWKMGKYDLAEKYLRRRVEELLLNDPELGPAYLNLGLVHSDKGDHAESLRWYEKALMAYMEIENPSYTAIGNLYNNIGEAHRQSDDYVEAMNSYNTALAIFEEAQDEHHPTMGLIYNNIGLIHHNQGNYSEALLFYEKSRAIYQDNLHHDHSRLALAYNNIGGVHLDLGNLDIALEYYERAASIYLKSLPPSHPSLALTYHNIGHVYEKKKEFSQAWQYYQKALEIRQHSLPTEHPQIKEAEQSVQRITTRL